MQPENQPKRKELKTGEAKTKVSLQIPVREGGLHPMDPIPGEPLSSFQKRKKAVVDRALKR